MKISIIGHCGSGKSYLSGKVSEKLALPLLHLDRLWFEEVGDNPSPKTIPEKQKVTLAVSERILTFIKQDSWISDGWSGGSQNEIAKSSDEIVFLDIPLWRRVINHVYRTFVRTDRLPELSMWDDLKFTIQVIKRTKGLQKKIDDLIAEHNNKVTILRNRKEIQDYLNTLA